MGGGDGVIGLLIKPERRDTRQIGAQMDDREATGAIRVSSAPPVLDISRATTRSARNSDSLSGS